MKLAERIQNLRKIKGLSQEDLAGEIGVSRQAVSKWESGQSTPDLDKIILLSDFFGVSTDYLLKGGEASPSPPATASQGSEKPNGSVFVIVGTLVNLSGLCLGSASWYEYQNVLSVAVELILMLVGCTVFAIGMHVCAPGSKAAAQMRFGRINIWIVSFPILSIFSNFLFGWGMIAPYPLDGIFVFVVLYPVVCIGCTHLLQKSIKSRS